MDVWCIGYYLIAWLRVGIDEGRMRYLLSETGPGQTRGALRSAISDVAAPRTGYR